MTNIDFKALMAKRAACQAPLKPSEANYSLKSPETLKPLEPTINRTITVYSADGSPKLITLNDNQLEFCRLLASGAACVLLGAAGTGKTSCTQAGLMALINSGLVRPLTDSTHKYLKPGAPGVVITAFTNPAVANVRRQTPGDLAANCITIHKLIEYSPIFTEVYDEEKGTWYKKREFIPLRNQANKLDSNLQFIVIDESSMVSLTLYKPLFDALPENCKLIFIGDINQLTPPMGKSILGFKINQLPVVELTEVYRTALDSPILSLAHRILSGNPILAPEFSRLAVPGRLQFLPFPKMMDSEVAMLETVKMFYEAYDSGAWNVDRDIILCPQIVNKESSNNRFNCTLINKYLAGYIARKNKRQVHEIIANFHKLYFSIGDRVTYNKQACIITDIQPNDGYIGQSYQEPSEHMDYFGHNSHTLSVQLARNDIDLDHLMELAIKAEQDGTGGKGSHKITLKIVDSHNETAESITLATIGELLALDLGYSTSVHKSQGMEWYKVFFLLHKSHNCMLSRELLYTAVTRARESLIIVCEKDSFIKGITNQRIKGHTLAEKAKFFSANMGEIGFELTDDEMGD